VIRIYGILALVSVSFLSGWFTNGWKEDSIRLAEKTASEKVMRLFASRESDIAIAVTEKLKGLKANERIIERHTQDIIERPVYRSICIDDDGLRQLNSYANGSTAIVTD
jgi:hypothetical protein